MENDPPRMIPIWFIIGINVLVFGVTILVTGIVRWNHPAPGVEMTQVHPDVWWGALMALIGLFYTIRFRPSRH